MLRTTNVLAAAAVVAVFVFGSALPAQAATGGDSDTTPYTTQCDTFYPPAEPYVAPLPPVAEDLKDAKLDPAAQGNAPIAGGVNCASGPGVLMETAPSEPGYVSVSVDDLVRIQQNADDAYVYIRRQTAVLSVAVGIATFAIIALVYMTILWYRRRPQPLE